MGIWMPAMMRGSSSSESVTLEAEELEGLRDRGGRLCKRTSSASLSLISCKGGKESQDPARLSRLPGVAGLEAAASVSLCPCRPLCLCPSQLPDGSSCCAFAARVTSVRKLDGGSGEALDPSPAAAAFRSFIAFLCTRSVLAYSNAFAFDVTTRVVRDRRPAGVGGAARSARLPGAVHR